MKLKFRGALSFISIMWIPKGYFKILKNVCLLAVFSVPVIGLCQSGNQTSSRIISIDKLGKTSAFLTPAKKYTVEIVQDSSRTNEDFPEDWFALKIWDQGRHLLASKPFYSSYQLFHIDIVDLDGNGEMEFISVFGTGRGTSARRETLWIEHYDGFHFKEELATPLSDYYDAGKRWWFSIEYKPGEEKGMTDIVLRLHIDAAASIKDFKKSGIPLEKIKIIRGRMLGT